MMRRRSLLTGLGAGMLGLPSLTLATPAWPGRGSIRLIAQFPPGGLVDTISRVIAPALGAALGQTVLVENRAGAAGVIGTEFAARAAPDGYTLLMSHASVHVFSAATMPSLPFDPIADFTHMAMLVEASSILAVRANSPFVTLEQYLEAARNRPVRYGSSGIGGSSHLLGEILKADSGAAQLDHVPYRGSAPALQDLLANQIDSMMDSITSNVQHLRDGTLRALATSAPTRLPGFPSVPTFTELGLPRVTNTQWLGLSAPKGLPPAIAERLTATIPALLQRPDLQARFADLQTVPRQPTPTGEAFIGIMREQLATWSAVARRFNIVSA